MDEGVEHPFAKHAARWRFTDEGKRNFVAEWGQRMGLRVLVETGTFRGGMLRHCLDKFERIHSVELQPEFALSASKEVSAYPHVTIYHEDSAEVLPEILKTVDEPCLLWLDAHYSGHDTALGSVACPVVDELMAVRQWAKPGSVVLIDDAFMFCEWTDWSYPELGRLMADMRVMFPECEVECEMDILMMFPKEE